MKLTQKQLESTFSTSLLLSFAIALTLALLIVQIGAQISNTLDNLVLASEKPTISLPQAMIPFGLITGSSPADDILVEWKTKRDNIYPVKHESLTKVKPDNIDQAIAEDPMINFPETIAPQDLDLTDFSIRELKQLAKMKGIAGYSKLTKAQLLTALR